MSVAIKNEATNCNTSNNLFSKKSVEPTLSISYKLKDRIPFQNFSYTPFTLEYDNNININFTNFNQFCTENNSDLTPQNFITSNTNMIGNQSLTRQFYNSYHHYYYPQVINENLFLNTANGTNDTGPKNVFPILDNIHLENINNGSDQQFIRGHHSGTTSSNNLALNNNDETDHQDSLFRGALERKDGKRIGNISNQNKLDLIDYSSYYNVPTRKDGDDYTPYYYNYNYKNYTNYYHSHQIPPNSSMSECNSVANWGSRNEVGAENNGIDQLTDTSIVGSHVMGGACNLIPGLHQPFLPFNSTSFYNNNNHSITYDFGHHPLKIFPKLNAKDETTIPTTSGEHENLKVQNSENCFSNNYGEIYENSSAFDKTSKTSDNNPQQDSYYNETSFFHVPPVNIFMPNKNHYNFSKKQKALDRKSYNENKLKSSLDFNSTVKMINISKNLGSNNETITKNEGLNRDNIIANDENCSINNDSNDPKDLEAFAEKFKQRRIKLGVTQADVGNALAKLRIPGVGALSQSTICRFESLTLSHNNMVALKPILQAWLSEAEAEVAMVNHNNKYLNGSNKTMNNNVVRSKSDHSSSSCSPVPIPSLHTYPGKYLVNYNNNNNPSVNNSQIINQNFGN
ncbi:unnamed protein product [Gordionus sp. m RMFG-2023]